MRTRSAGELAQQSPEPSRGRWLAWLARLLTAAFFVALMLLLATRARNTDWHSVARALAAYDAGSLLVAAGLAVASYAVYSSFDLFGRWYTAHVLPARRVMATAFVSYACNLNLGALVGGVALRYRLYSRQGLSTSTITRILGLSLMTNWLGYLAVAGTLFAAGVVELPADWKFGNRALRVLGGVLCLAAAAYIALCAASPWREASVRGVSLPLPPARLAGLQLGLSALNWTLIGAIPYVLIGGAAPYHEVLAVLLIAAIAGVVTHVPAGLGVVEAVFLGLLGSRVEEARLLAALLAYRAVYYLLPLLLALLTYAGLEWRARRLR